MVPKKYVLQCKACRWSETSTGISADLAHLQEIPNSCPTCGKPRQFRCPKCKTICKLLKIKGGV